MKLKLFIIGVFILSIAIGCDKKANRIFEENPTDRLNISVDKVYTVLQANKAGWVMEYFPSKQLEFGGYTLFAKFTNNVDVSIEGDFTTMAPQVSTFTVVPSAGPILTFDTFNPIFHYFALPQYFTRLEQYQLPGFFTSGLGAINEGMKGENDFVVLKATADSVVLEGRKSYNRLVMLPIKASDEATIISTYKAAVTKFYTLGAFKFEVGTETIPATFSNTTAKRALKVADNSVPYSYRYTPTGLSFYKEYELKGIKFKTLKYMEPTGIYTKGYFTNDAGTIKLVPTT